MSDKLKYLSIPAEVACVSVAGAPLLERTADGGALPIVVSMQKFLLTLLADPLFTKGKKGIEAAELVQATRERILSESAAADGFIALDHEMARRLRDVVEGAEFDPQLAHNLVPFMRAVVDAADRPPQARERSSAMAEA